LLVDIGYLLRPRSTSTFAIIGRTATFSVLAAPAIVAASPGAIGGPAFSWPPHVGVMYYVNWIGTLIALKCLKSIKAMALKNAWEGIKKMNTRIKQNAILTLSLVLAIAATGCINMSATPTYSSSGDLVQIGLGGVKRNSFGRTITADDIIATITSDADGVEYQVKVRNVYRAFPDHTSQYAVKTQAGDGFYDDLHPYDGQWWVTLQLVEHTSSNTEFLPLPLASGPAIIKIYSAALIDTGWDKEGSLLGFNIEMLPDAADPLSARVREPTATDPYQFVALSPEVTLEINPDTLVGVSVVGGLQIKLDYNPNAVVSGDPSIPRLVPISHDPNINIIQNTVDIPDVGDGKSRALVAMVTNPNGFVELYGGSWAIGKSTFDDLQFAITVKDGNALGGNWSLEYSLDPTESFYVDNNGDVIAGMTPVLAKSY
jgi:hypothetical protein